MGFGSDMRMFRPSGHERGERLQLDSRWRRYANAGREQQENRGRPLAYLIAVAKLIL